MAWFEHEDGRVYYEEHGEGDLLLLMPGFTQAVGDLAEVIAAAAGKYRVIAADLPGSGRSGPQPRSYGPDFYQQDAWKMAALLNHLGTGPVRVAGFSDGGEVALLLAVQSPELVRSLLVWGAAGTLGEGDALPLLDGIYSVADNPSEEMRGWSEHLKAHYGESVALDTMRSWATAGKAILSAGGDISLSRAGEIKCPTLIIAGEFDPFCTPAMTRQLVARIPDALLMQVPGAGHLVHEEQPEWFKLTLLKWLERE